MTQVYSLLNEPQSLIYLACIDLRSLPFPAHSVYMSRAMLVQTKDFVDVAARARELGCHVPARIALLPGNFATAATSGEFRYHTATRYVRSAWQSVDLEDEGPDSESGIRDLGLGADSCIRTPVPSPQSLAPSASGSQPPAPSASAQVPLVAFFGAGLLTGTGSSLAVALSLVSRVLALHPECASPREVRFDAVVKRPGDGYACLEYRGDAYGLISLAREVRAVWESAGGRHSGEAVRSLHEAAGEGCRTEMDEALKRSSLSKEGGAV
jgi:hypothetical protein